SRTQVVVGAGEDFARDLRFTETVARGVSFAPATFDGTRPGMSISFKISGFTDGVTVADIDLRFLNDFLSEGQVGRTAFAYVVDARGKVLASSAHGPAVAKDLAALPQVAALIASDGRPVGSGVDADGNAVLTAAATVPKLGWLVFFEQPTAQ